MIIYLICAAIIHFHFIIKLMRYIMYKLLRSQSVINYKNMCSLFIQQYTSLLENITLFLKKQKQSAQLYSILLKIN